MTLCLEICPRLYLVQFLRSALRLLGVVSSIPRMVFPLLLLAILPSSFSWSFQMRAQVRRWIPSQRRNPLSKWCQQLSYPESWLCLTRRWHCPNLVSWGLWAEGRDMGVCSGGRSQCPIISSQPRNWNHSRDSRLNYCKQILSEKWSPVSPQLHLRDFYLPRWHHPDQITPERMNLTTMYNRKYK